MPQTQTLIPLTNYGYQTLSNKEFSAMINSITSTHINHGDGIRRAIIHNKKYPSNIEWQYIYSHSKQHTKEFDKGFIYNNDMDNNIIGIATEFNHKYNDENTMLFNDDHIYHLRIANFLTYCILHNYTLIMYNTSYDDDLQPFPLHFSKPFILRHLLKDVNPNLKWVFWIDFDTIFPDCSLSLNNIIRKYDSYNLLISGINSSQFNSGVFGLKNCQWTIYLLEKWSFIIKHYY